MNTAEMTQQLKHSRISKHAQQDDNSGHTRFAKLFYKLFFDETTNEKTSKAHVR